MLSHEEGVIMQTREADILIIGSGIAGLFAAELLAKEKNVTIVTKGKLQNSNSILAQGGIAAAIGKDDKWENHFTDTIIAGNYHNSEQATRVLVENAVTAIKQLIDLGVPFDKSSIDELLLGKEGGHHKRRIVHAGGDSTGREVINTLINKVKNKVKIYEDEMTLDLVVDNKVCLGAITKNTNGELYLYKANHIILATGGIGGLYSLTSNDKTLTGDGMAMAYRAGVELADLEFIQFHPTMLVKNNKAYGLISEAVRGEGAKLVTNMGNYIMRGMHPLGDLAPRDIVARRIFDAEQKGEKVFLDISMIDNFFERFPTITQLCKDNNINPGEGLIPVSPGAHFIMGGVKTNLHGETNIKGLYAIGEVSYTGVHGANRLASNSLLEGIIFANRLAKHILEQPAIQPKNFVQPKLKSKNILLPNIDAINTIMTENVGIVRTESSLKYAKKWFELFLPANNTNLLLDLTAEQMTKLNMVTIGWLITTSALNRTESRGGHYRSDYPLANDEKWLKRYIVRRREGNESYQIENATTTAFC